jgi:hypothetical protein
MYPVLNEASCHGDVWGSGGIAPHILNLHHVINLPKHGGGKFYIITISGPSIE